MIKLVDVNKQYGENKLFQNLNICFNQQKIKIKGENGSGKSVLLKLIVGYSLPDSGHIYYDDNKELRKEADFLENAGISINAPEFMHNWSGMDNLMYLAKITNRCSQEKIMALADIFGLTSALKKKYKTYSLGMKQKMRIIQAVMDDPKYLILDEPFDALDETAKKTVRDYLNHYLKEDKNRMLIYTSHSEADDVFADEIYCIDNYQVKKNEKKDN